MQPGIAVAPLNRANYTVAFRFVAQMNTAAFMTYPNLVRICIWLRNAERNGWKPFAVQQN
jgi:hypothetical protein